MKKLFALLLACICVIGCAAAEIIEEIGPVESAAVTPEPTPTPVVYEDLEYQMTNHPGVYALQERLIQLRYLTGVADGVFGLETQSALIEFTSPDARRSR